MTKKDYVRIAGAFKTTEPDAKCDSASQVHQWLGDVKTVADALAADDPKFNRARFYTACGVQS
jgi:hypothetical protein